MLNFLRSDILTEQWRLESGHEREPRVLAERLYTFRIQLSVWQAAFNRIYAL